MDLKPLLIFVLLVPGCASPENNQSPPEGCRPDFTPVGDTQPGVDTVAVPIRLVSGLNGEPVDTIVGVSARGSAPRSSLSSKDACTLAFGQTGEDGQIVLRTAPGTWHIVAGKPFALTGWTLEHALNVSVQEGMPEIVMPIWPQQQTFTYSGEISGLDPTAESETVESIHLFADVTDEDGTLLRLGDHDGMELRFLNLTWTNTATNYAGLGLRIYAGTTFTMILDGSGDTEAGAQGERKEHSSFEEATRWKAIAEGLFVEVSDTGPMVAAQPIPFQVSFTARFIGPNR